MSRLPSLCLGLLLLPAVLPAHAQGDPVPATRAEYRACLEERDQLEPKLESLRTRKAEHETQVKQYQEEMDALVATEKSVDKNDRTAVERYNAKMSALNTRGRTLNTNAEGFAKELEAVRTQVAAMNTRCSNRSVSDRDREAVNKERAAQGKK